MNQNQQSMIDTNAYNTKDFTRTNLFFIKSKHAFRQFKNHDYFQTKNASRIQKTNSKSNQFVGQPTPFGINNAYDYICQEIAKNYLKNHKRSLNKLKLKTQNSEQDQKINIINTSYQRRRKTQFTLPNLTQQKKINYRLINTASFLQTNKEQPATTAKDKQKIWKKQLNINLIFIDKLQHLSKVGSFELKLNIYEYVVNTFLKAKVNYNEITEQEFQEIKAKILQIYETGRQYFQYKDIVNLKNVKEIFEILKKYSDSISKNEIFRYFFVAQKEIYRYQLEKIKDKIKELINFQFNKDINNDELYIFEANSGIEIDNLYDLMKYNTDKFVFGADKNSYQIYSALKKEKQTQNHLINRIKKWKSIIPQTTIKQAQFHCMTADKYQKLFNRAINKRQRYSKNKKKPIVSLKCSQFISKQKLYRDDNIFQ